MARSGEEPPDVDETFPVEHSHPTGENLDSKTEEWIIIAQKNQNWGTFFQAIKKEVR